MFWKGFDSLHLLCSGFKHSIVFKIQTGPVKLETEHMKPELRVLLIVLCWSNCNTWNTLISHTLLSLPFSSSLHYTPSINCCVAKLCVDEDPVECCWDSFVFLREWGLLCCWWFCVNGGKVGICVPGSLAWYCCWKILELLISVWGAENLLSDWIFYEKFLN